MHARFSSRLSTPVSFANLLDSRRVNTAQHEYHTLSTLHYAYFLGGGGRGNFIITGYRGSLSFTTKVGVYSSMSYTEAGMPQHTHKWSVVLLYPKH